jgi:hypothetical protein
LEQQVIARLHEHAAQDVRELDGAVEKIVFPLPRGLGSRAAKR